MIWFAVFVAIVAGIAFGLLAVELSDRRDDVGEYESSQPPSTEANSRPAGNVRVLPRERSDGGTRTGSP
jgi:hypothetical protein